MDVTAQNSKVNDIWSTMDQPVQVNPPPTDPDNPQNNPNVRDDGGVAPSAPSASPGSFGKPGLARGGENGGWQESLTAEELLEKARKQEAEQVAELYKPSETRKSSEVPGSVEVATSPEVSRATEVGEKLRPAEVLRPPESVPSPEVQKPQSKKAPSESPESSPKVAQQPQDIAGKVVEKRTSKEKLHRVDINKADSVTKIADIKEQDFIENVEKEHIKSIL